MDEKQAREELSRLLVNLSHIFYENHAISLTLRDDPNSGVDHHAVATYHASILRNRYR